MLEMRVLCEWRWGVNGSLSIEMQPLGCMLWLHGIFCYNGIILCDLDFIKIKIDDKIKKEFKFANLHSH